VRDGTARRRAKRGVSAQSHAAPQEEPEQGVGPSPDAGAHSDTPPSFEVLAGMPEEVRPPRPTPGVPTVVLFDLEVHKGNVKKELHSYRISELAAVALQHTDQGVVRLLHFARHKLAGRTC
jgi:hypothetical protein